MLPYFYYKCRHSKGLYPWLIGRKFIEDITGVKNADDGVRQLIYEALEAGRSDFEDFCIFCEDRILNILNSYPGLKQVPIDLLSSAEGMKTSGNLRRFIRRICLCSTHRTVAENSMSEFPAKAKCVAKPCLKLSCLLVLPKTA